MTEEEKRKERSARSVAQAKSKDYIYQKKYGKKNVYHFQVNLNLNTDTDIIEFLESLESKAGWFKDVCRRELNK